MGIKTFKNYISNALYEDYNIDECGFVTIYEILHPYFGKFNPLDNKDYKTVLQEYAPGRREVLIYEVLGTEGLEHEKIYTVRVTVGNKIAIGSAVGKKRVITILVEKTSLNSINPPIM